MKNLTSSVGDTREYRRATEVSQCCIRQSTNEESQLSSFF